jgi:hypothetical protein
MSREHDRLSYHRIPVYHWKEVLERIKLKIDKIRKLLPAHLLKTVEYPVKKLFNRVRDNKLKVITHHQLFD